MRRNPCRRLLALAGAALLVLVGPARADDTVLFTTSVPPNVLLLVDNSGSMREIMYHPSFDSSKTTCGILDRVAPNPGSSTSDGWKTSKDQNDRSLSAYCFPGGDCVFLIDSGDSNFKKTGTVSCPGGSTRDVGYVERRYCGRTRPLYLDPVNVCLGAETRWTEQYIEWYFSPDADSHFLGNESNTSTDVTKIDANDNGTDYITGTTYPLYKRSRTASARQVAREVIYRTNSNCGLAGGFPCPAGSNDKVRFGFAKFDTTSGFPGGYVTAPLDDYSSNATSLETAIAGLDNSASTPLAESLFKIYSYFMSRSSSERPLGKNGSTRFPKYQYAKSNGANTSSPPGDPLSCAGGGPCECQKNFVVMITDGEPASDDFSTSGSGNSNTGGRTVGFSDFVPRLVGNFNTDSETEEPSSGNWRYLDDLAKFMHDRDFRLDLDGSQTLDVYTVGFATSQTTNDLLQRTATQGGGSFFASDQTGVLTNKLLDVINDVIEKSQQFTSATVPAVRTSAGGSFYTSQFTPRTDSGFWRGQLQSWTITADAKILDSTGACALDEDPPCTSGFITSLNPWWDAAEEIPAPASRNLFTSVAGASDKVPFRHDLLTTGASDQIDATDLGVSFPPAATYPGSTATDAEEFAAEVVANLRGCEFGTGANGVACTTRADLLGDIFHSNPVVVPKPSAFLDEASYRAFSTLYGETPNVRDRVIVAGANDGFLHVFHAGDWQTSTTSLGPINPPGYDVGSGAEIAGFMPYTARQNAKEIQVDSGARDYYFVDGGPTVADVWIHTQANGRQASKASDGSEWRTVLVGGMRQGGRQYYALDITDPDAPGYPGYLWEFPTEVDWAVSPDLTDSLGETWSEPVVTRIRLGFKNGDDNSGQGYERWVAVVGGGYDPVSDPNSGSYDPSAQAGRAIMIIDLKTGQLLARKRFDAGATDGQEQMLYAIPSTPAVFDLDFDGFADVIYVGDVGGNVWKWVIKDLGIDAVNDPLASSADWNQPQWPFKKYFQAPSYDDGSKVHYKSFHHPPAATFKNGKLWLAFGSGQRTDLLGTGIVGTTAENDRFYSMVDLDPLERNATPEPTLTEASMLDVTGDPSCSDVSGYRGFYFLADDGEKFITSPDVFFYRVFVASFKPTAAANACEAGGTAFLYAFKIYCGEGLFDSDGNGTPETRTELDDKGLPSDPKISIGPNGSEVIINQRTRIQNIDTGVNVNEQTGQAYWREMD